MKCPGCTNSFIGSCCHQCGYNINKSTWKTVARLYPPNDIIVESLLKSYDLPFRIYRKEINQFPITIGPLAEVRIAVPEEIFEEVQELLDTNINSV